LLFLTTSQCFPTFDGPVTAQVSILSVVLVSCERGGYLLAARVLPARPRGGAHGMPSRLAPRPSAWQPSRRAAGRSPPPRPSPSPKRCRVWAEPGMPALARLRVVCRHDREGDGVRFDRCVQVSDRIAQPDEAGVPSWNGWSVAECAQDLTCCFVSVTGGWTRSHLALASRSAGTVDVDLGAPWGWLPVRSRDANGRVPALGPNNT
jgi:hypothetical protein